MKPLLSSSSSSSSASLLKKTTRLSPLLFTLLIFVVFFTCLYGQDISQLFLEEQQQQHGPEPPLQPRLEMKSMPERLPFAVEEEDEECDLYAGKWVWDDVTRPMYRESDCPYLPPQVTCQAEGRPDRGYQNWRWQPHGCALPSFNATLVLETLRNKRMMFVGDSLNRGQFTSFVCLVHSVIPEGSKSWEKNGSLTVFSAKDYNATIEFYWAPFLLESNSDDAIIHKLSDRMVRRGSINKHAHHWKDVDVIVFNTYVWWMTGDKFRILEGQGPMENASNQTVWVSTEEAYGMAFRDMLQWVKDHMDPRKTRVFFMGMSPSHNKSQDWGDAAGGSCWNQTTMIEDRNNWGSDCRRSIMGVIRGILDETDVPIAFVNITQLSAYRRDAHSGIYKKQWLPLTPEQIANPVSYADCVHWCIPGVQDTWNELLYAKLFYP